MTLSILMKYRLPFFAPEGVGGGASQDPAPSPGSTTPSSSPSAPSSTPSGAPSTPTVPTAPAPTAKPTAPPTEAAPDLGFDYASIFEAPSDAPSVVVPVTPAAKPGEAQVPPVAAEAPAGTEAKPPAAPPVEAVQQTPGQQETPPAQPAVGAPQYDPADPASLARALRENESVAVQHIAESVFRLSPEELGALETDVGGTIPKLMARVMVKSQQQMFTLLSQFVPQMIRQHDAVTKRQTGYEDVFYKAWPQLDRVKHGDLVQKYGAMYRRTNPDAPTEKMIQELGLMVSALAGAVAAAPKGTPAKPNGAAPPQPSFVPAQPGSVGHSSVPEAGPYDFLGRAE